MPCCGSRLFGVDLVVASEALVRGVGAWARQVVLVLDEAVRAHAEAVLLLVPCAASARTGQCADG
eukprot:4777551-Pleurochrysis_carterae.AAC.1